MSRFSRLALLVASLAAPLGCTQSIDQPSAVLTADDSGISAVATSEDEDLVAFADGNGRLYLSRMSVPRALPLKDRLGDIPMALQFTKKSQAIVCTGCDGRIVEYDIGNGGKPRTLWDPFPWDGSVVDGPWLTRDGEMLVYVTQDNALVLCHVRSKKVVSRLVGHELHVMYAVFSRSGRFLATAAQHELKLWDLASTPLTPRPRWSLLGFYTDALAFSSDETVLVAGSTVIRRLKAPLVRAFDVLSGRELPWSGGHAANTVAAIAVSGDGAMVAMGDDGMGRVQVWGLRDGRLIREIAAHSSRVLCVQFSYDGQWLVTGDGRTIKLWRLSPTHETRR